jgi:hypothetical protein
MRNIVSNAGTLELAYTHDCGVLLLRFLAVYLWSDILVVGNCLVRGAIAVGDVGQMLPIWLLPIRIWSSPVGNSFLLDRIDIRFGFEIPVLPLRRIAGLSAERNTDDVCCHCRSVNCVAQTH